MSYVIFLSLSGATLEAGGECMWMRFIKNMWEMLQKFDPIKSAVAFWMQLWVELVQRVPSKYKTVEVVLLEEVTFISEIRKHSCKTFWEWMCLVNAYPFSWLHSRGLNYCICEVLIPRFVWQNTYSGCLSVSRFRIILFRCEFNLNLSFLSQFCCSGAWWVIRFLIGNRITNHLTNM